MKENYLKYKTDVTYSIEALKLLVCGFLPIIILRRGSEKHIATAVEGGLDGVLHHTNDKTYGDCLHGHIVADAEERTRHRNKQQRTTRHARGTASAEGGDETQKDRRSKTDLHTDSMCHGKGKDSDGHGGTVHVDGGAQRNADGIVVLIKVKLLAERHVDGNIGR